MLSCQAVVRVADIIVGIMATPSDRPLRILHLTLASEHGGVSRYLYDLCSVMAKAGHQPIIAGAKGAWHDLFEDAPWPWLTIPIQGGVIANWQCKRQLLRELHSQRIDIIHAHYRRSSMLGRKLAGPLNAPLLFTLHMPSIPMGFPWNLLSEFGDHAMTCSQTSSNWLRDVAGVPDQRITTIPLGIDPEQFPMASDQVRAAARKQLGLPVDATIAAFVGRFGEPKNENWIIDLAEASAAALPHVHFLLMGMAKDTDPPMLGRIADAGLAERVTVLPYGSPLPAYQACDLLLVPSSSEGFALVCAEAMSVGRPVLRTRTGGYESQIIENVTGKSVPVDHDQFIAAAIDMLRDPAALSAMGQNAAQHVREHLTLEQQVQQTIELYRKLIAERQR